MINVSHEATTTAEIKTEQITKITPGTKSTTTAEVKGTISTTTADLLSADLQDEIKHVVREEVERIAQKLIAEETEREIEEKISGRKISSNRRSRVHKKVIVEVNKKIQHVIEKITKDQLKNSISDRSSEERRVSGDVEKDLMMEVRLAVQRSMEKAIADEIFQQVKFEKLSRTPTAEPKLGDTFAGKIGVRHAQTFMILLFLLISFIQRTDMSVALVAMTNGEKANPNFQQFMWSEQILGLLLSSFFWGYFAMQLPGGILAERYGPKIIMSASMLLCSFSSLLIPSAILVGDWVGLYIMKLIQGVGQGFFIPAVYVFTARWIPPNEKSRLFTPAFGGMQLGTVIGMPITGLLCASFAGWPSAFFFSGIVGFIWVIVWIFVAANSPSVHRSISREEQLYIEGSFGFGEITVKGAEKRIPWKPIMTSIPFWALMITHFGQNWAYFTLLTEMPVYINFVLQVNITDNGFLSAMTYFAGWLLIVIFGFVSHSFHQRKWMSVTVERKVWNSVAFYGGSIPFFILGFTKTKSLKLAITLLTITIASNSTVYNGVFSNHADLSPNYVGILMGLSNTFGNFASLLAPLFVGAVVKDPNSVDQWSIVFITSGALMIVTNTIYIFFGTAEIQPWNTPSDLHLQLEEKEFVEHRMQRRGENRTVNTFFMPKSVEENHKPTDMKHRNSI